MKLKLGSHMCVTKGLKKTIEDGKALHFSCIQIYCGGNRCAKRTKLEIPDKVPFPVFIHASLIFYLQSKKNFQNYVKEGITLELKTAFKLPGSAVVVHPGTIKGIGYEKAVENIIDNIKELYETPDLGRLALENCAGEGYKIPKNVDEIRDLVKDLPRDKVGVCIDTCHLFAAGYDISKPEVVDAFYEEFKIKVGLDRLFVIHLNDSSEDCGSKKDRHAPIGFGKIWGFSTESLARFFFLFSDIPMVSETGAYIIRERAAIDQALTKASLVFYDLNYFTLSATKNVYTRKEFKEFIEDFIQKAYLTYMGIKDRVEMVEYTVPIGKEFAVVNYEVVENNLVLFFECDGSPHMMCLLDMEDY